jgi:hypothetical protein
MTIALLKQRRELNKRKLAALAFLAMAADVDEWPERLEGLAKKAEALGNESLVRSLVQEVVQVVAMSGNLPTVRQAVMETAAPAEEAAEPAAPAKGKGKSKAHEPD